jgi:hypothetical protein
MFEGMAEHGCSGPGRGSVVASIHAAANAGPSLESLVPLLRVDPANLDPEDAVLFLQALERHFGWMHAIQARAIVAAAGPQRATWEVVTPNSTLVDPDPGIDDILREEIASATGWGSGHAQHRMEVARLLIGHLPKVFTALECGSLTYAHAAAIAAATAQLPGHDDPELASIFHQACADLEDRVLQTALRSNVTRTRRAASRAAAEIADADLGHRRRHQQLAQFVSLVDDPDGLSTLTARMPAHYAHACMAAIRKLADDPMLDLPCDASIGQRRALALATLVIGPHPAVTSVSHAGKAAPIAPRPTVHLDIVIGLDALLGLNERPGVIPGAGHVPADIVRGLLADATMRRMVTDPLSGHLLDLGRRTYRIPDRLRRFIEARDQTCRFPGCGRRAIHCEIDHATPWSSEGTTSPANLGALCTRHHRMKTHAGWTISDSDVGGGCTWTSPFGHVYPHRPPPPLQYQPPPPTSLRSPPKVSREPELLDEPARLEDFEGPDERFPF